MTRARASLLLPLLAACTFEPDPVSARGDGAPAGRDRDAAGAGDDGPANEADAESDAGRILFGTPELVSELSTTGDEDDVTLRADLLEIFFERGDDLYSATRASTEAPWQSVAAIGALSSTDTDSTPEVAWDGLTIFFGSSRPGGLGGADIWSSTRFSVVSGWDTPVVQTNLNSSSSDSTPVPSDDLLRVTFSSTRDGTNDLFTSTRADTGAAWDPPTAMTDLNTASVEAEPFLVDEGRVIYFTSDRPGGLGGRDMWRAVRADAASAFGAPEPVTELNGSANEQDPWLTQDERVIFFASDRSGNWEIYQASR